MSPGDEVPIVLVLGTGSLAVNTCSALMAGGGPCSVRIFGRNASKAALLQRCFSLRAASAESRTTFPDTELPDFEHAWEAIALFQPAIVFVCASAQSPWEAASGNGWARCVAAAGFGITLPFQLFVAMQACRIVGSKRLSSLVINGCYPDATNRFLAVGGCAPYCGIGNIGIMTAAALREGQRNFKLVAHHQHLSCVLSGEEFGPHPLIQEDGATARKALPHDFNAVRGLVGPDLNLLTGQLAANLILSLIRGGKVYHHVPGPLGLPGGYPVEIDGHILKLALPEGVDVSEAIAVNEEASAAEGVVIDTKGSRVVFTGRVADVLSKHSRELSGGFSCSDYLEVYPAFVELREKLRAL